MNRKFLTQKLPILMGFALLLSTAACTKKVPAQASRPADTTPVTSSPAPTRQMAQRDNTPSQQSERQTNRRPGEMTPAERASLNASLARLEDALFDYDKSAIRADASTALTADVGVIRDILANYPNQKLLIEGNCDERGSEEYNMALGDRRAKAAEQLLVSMGIPGPQLTIISFGKDRPVCTTEDETCWQKNRRAHVTAAP